MRSVWQVIISVSAEGNTSEFGRTSCGSRSSQKSQLGISFLCSRAERKTESGCNLIPAMEAVQKKQILSGLPECVKERGICAEGGWMIPRLDQDTLRKNRDREMIVDL